MKVKNNHPVYTISIAADLSSSHPRTLMLYESRGLIKPFRTDTNRRLYSAQNVKEIAFIQYLTQTKGINLAGVKFVLDMIDFCKSKKIEIKDALFNDFQGDFPY